MPSTLTITGPTFTNKVATALPTIPALQTLCFFGTGGDGINTNRASGPALSIMSGAPVYGTNYVSLGAQSGRQDVLETNNPRTTAVLASGWTYAAVARNTGALANASAINDMNGTPIGGSAQLYMRNAVPSTFILYENAARATLTTVTTTNNFHFIAATYTGGASGTWTIYDFTDQPTTGMPQTYAQTGFVTGAQSPHLGGLSTDTFTGPIDISFAMVSFSPLSAGAISTLAASVRSFLARRGITC